MLLTFLFLWTTTAAPPNMAYAWWVNSGTFVSIQHCEQAIVQLGVGPKKARCVGVAVK